MSLKRVHLLSAVLCVGMLGFVGCEDDDNDKGTNGNPPAGGVAQPGAWNGNGVVFNVSAAGDALTATGSPYTVPNASGTPVPYALACQYTASTYTSVLYFYDDVPIEAGSFSVSQPSSQVVVTGTFSSTTACSGSISEGNTSVTWDAAPGQGPTLQVADASGQANGTAAYDAAGRLVMSIE